MCQFFIAETFVEKTLPGLGMRVPLYALMLMSVRDTGMPSTTRICRI